MDSIVARRRCLAMLAAAPAVAFGSEPVLVFAAASLTDVLRRFEAHSTFALRFSFAASSTLARQIEQGAPAHLFISADVAWMDHLERLKRIEPASRRVLAGNRLVVVVPAAAAQPPAAPALPESVQALRNVLSARRIATGDPAHVPVGRYAEQALRRVGLWDEVAPRLVRAESVRSALVFIERGEAAASIVYASDALASPRVRAVARFAGDLHEPIAYPAALVTGAPPRAREVFAQLFGATMRRLLDEAGFIAAH